VKPRKWPEPSCVFRSSSCQVRVRFQEVDALRVVWHGHYLSYFEEGRNAFGREHGFGYQEILEAGFVAPLVHVELDYLKSAHFDQLLSVRTHMHHDEAARIQFTYAIESEHGDLLCRGRTIQFITDLAGELVLARPRFVSDFYAKWPAPLEVD
jgi:acyl-CoA thioester hydrolase